MRSTTVAVIGLTMEVAGFRVAMYFFVAWALIIALIEQSREPRGKQ